MNQTIKNRIEQIKNGQVPEGYKKTSFGVFPNDWETNTFGKLFDFYGGLGVPRDKLGESGIPYLHYGDMHRNFTNIVSYQQYELLPKYDVAIKGKENYLMRDGDVIFLDASEDLDGTSRCVLVDNPDNRPFIAGLHTFIAREKSNNYSKYFKQYITSNDYIKRQFFKLAVGFKVSGLNGQTIKKIKVAYPKSHTEQAKIAEILMQWDMGIEKQEQLISKLEARKKALMQRVITPKDSWRKVSLKEILKEHKAYSVKNNGYTHVTLSKEGIVDKTEQYNRDFLVSNDVEKKYKITRLNDLCYNPANLKFGVICLNTYGTAIFSPIYVTFKINTKFNAYFVSTILTSNNFINYIRKYEEGSLYERQAVKPKIF